MKCFCPISIKIQSVVELIKVAVDDFYTFLHKTFERHFQLIHDNVIMDSNNTFLAS